MKAVTVDVDKSVPRVPLKSLLALQGDLKKLAPDDEERLKKSILERGFFVPIFIWKDKAKYKILDGHQRVRVLKRLEESGHKIPEIPVVALKAKTEKEAKEKLLLITSQYGKVQEEGLATFLKGLDHTMLVTDFQLANIDTQKFLDKHFPTGTDLPTAQAVAAAEGGGVSGDLRSVGGSGIKMLQVFFNEKQHAEVMNILAHLKKKYKTENATETVYKALQDAKKANP